MENIKTELIETVEKLGEELIQFPWDTKKCYQNWIAQTYFFVKHTSTFLELSVPEWGKTNKEMQKRAQAHLLEEMGHEKYLLNDLKNMDSDISMHKEFPETQAFYQTQYYWISNVSPAAHLGYAYLLEGLAALKGPQIYEKVKNNYGENCGSFIRVHAHEDQGHFEEAISTLSSLSNEELKHLSENLKQASLLYSLILKKASIN